MAIHFLTPPLPLWHHPALSFTQESAYTNPKWERCPLLPPLIKSEWPLQPQPNQPPNHQPYWLSIKEHFHFAVVPSPAIYFLSFASIYWLSPHFVCHPHCTLLPIHPRFFRVCAAFLLLPSYCRPAAALYILQNASSPLAAAIVLCCLSSLLLYLLLVRSCFIVGFSFSFMWWLNVHDLLGII